MPARYTTPRSALHLATLALLAAAASPHLFAQSIPGVPGSDGFGYAVTHGDFDGNGVQDLAIGAYAENVGAAGAAGSVTVIYNGPDGVGSGGVQMWTQNSPGTPDQAETSDQLGISLAAGDFNGDGIDDLAAGANGEEISGLDFAGAVLVLYGSGDGLTATGSQFWHQNSTNILGGSEANDEFGWALAAGDFNGDGVDDLAIGVVLEDVGSTSDVGAVNVIYGTSGGLTSVGNQIWNQDSEGVGGGAEAGDSFGFSLAAGDFDRDGRDDLAIGVPRENIESDGNAGAVQVLRGSASGITASGDQFWDQSRDGIEGAPEPGDGFGWSLAVGDFNGDDRDDLAIGVAGEAIGSLAGAGAVAVLYSGSGGLSADGDQFWSQDGSIAGGPEQEDFFGFRLAAGDFDGDGRDDLAVGVKNEDVGDVAHAGAVNVIFGDRGGLIDVDNQYFQQDSPGLRETPEAEDFFGVGLAAADFDGDGIADLAIGAYGEGLGGASFAGLVHLLFGEPNTGLTGEGSAQIRQGGGLPVAAEAAAPAGLYRLDAAPNPAATHSTIRFEVPEAGDVRLEVFDALGRSVAVLASGPHAAGAHEATFDASRLPAGVYVVRLGAGAATLSMPVTVVR